MIHLKNVVCISVSCDKVDQTIKAMEHCKKYFKFQDSFIFTDKKIDYNHKIINPIKSIKDYDNFIVKDLPFHIKADYCLSIHWDGFIVNPEAFTVDFFKYDYIGSPWPEHGNICGNGGFCLKSKRFFKAQKLLIKTIKKVDCPDDVFLCIKYRDWFITNGINYAPPHIGYRFATEQGEYNVHRSFGFHDFRLHPQFKSLVA